MRTFVVRVWIPPSGTDGGLRGVVERIGSNEEVTFRNADELLAILAGRTAADETPVSRMP